MNCLGCEQAKESNLAEELKQKLKTVLKEKSDLFTLDEAPEDKVWMPFSADIFRWVFLNWKGENCFGNLKLLSGQTWRTRMERTVLRRKIRGTDT